MRFFFLALVILTWCIVSPASGQPDSPGQTVAVKGGDIRDKSTVLGETKFTLSRGDSVLVLGWKEEGYLRVRYSTPRDTIRGWLSQGQVVDESFRERRVRRLTRREAEKMYSYSNGVVNYRANVRPRPISSSDGRGMLAEGDSVAVVDTAGAWVRVFSDSLGGWTYKDYIDSESNIRQQRQARRERREYLEMMRRKGYTIRLIQQGFEKNSADGVTPTITITNIAEDKTVKYARITLRLFNSVGDATSGQHSPASQTVRAVGPIETGERGHYEFDNTWYSSVGSCTEIRRIVVQHIDGSRFTYVNDLQDIAKQAEGVRLQGDCSYEAQKRRR